jgi:hypothetical protein
METIVIAYTESPLDVEVEAVIDQSVIIEVAPELSEALNLMIDIGFDVASGLGDRYEKYKGSYEITPRLEGQVVETKDKVLLDDLRVKEIPIQRVSNIGGGTTIYIG